MYPRAQGPLSVDQQLLDQIALDMSSMSGTHPAHPSVPLKRSQWCRSLFPGLFFWIKYGAKCKTPIKQPNALIYIYIWDTSCGFMGSWMLETIGNLSTSKELDMGETQKQIPGMKIHWCFLQCLKLQLHCLNQWTNASKMHPCYISMRDAKLCARDLALWEWDVCSMMAALPCSIPHIYILLYTFYCIVYIILYFIIPFVVYYIVL